jgi:hypothetical protein
MTERQTRDSDRKKEIYPQLISENHICTELAFKFDILLSGLKKMTAFVEEKRYM